MKIAQDLTAEVHDHGPVPIHKGGEGGFARGVRRQLNRSMSWRSVNPTTEPPSNSDSIC